MDEDKLTKLRQYVLQTTKDLWEFNDDMHEVNVARHYKIQTSLRSVRAAVDDVATARQAVDFIKFFEKTLVDLLLSLKIDELKSQKQNMEIMKKTLECGENYAKL